MTGDIIEKKEKDVISLDRVFKPDPHDNEEDPRPVEIKKGRLHNPDGWEIWGE